MQYKQVLFVVFLLGSIPMVLNAQQTLSTAGGSASGTGGSASYTLGQVMCSTKGASGGIITEGVQQPFEIFAVTGFNDPAAHLEILFFPNPVRDEITLCVMDFASQHLTYRLTDQNGKLICQDKITRQETRISMNGLASSTYFMSILNKNKDCSIFKIIKY